MEAQVQVEGNIFCEIQVLSILQFLPIFIFILQLVNFQELCLLKTFLRYPPLIAAHEARR